MWVCSMEANCRTAGWCATSLLCCNNCVSPVCKRVLGLLSYESNFCEIQAFKGGEKNHPWNQVFVQLVNSSVVLKGSLRVYICSFLFPCSTSYSNFSLKMALHVWLCMLCWLGVSDISTVPPTPVTRGTNWLSCAEITLHVPIPGSPSVLPSCLLQFTLLGGQPEVPIVYFPGL